MATNVAIHVFHGGIEPVPSMCMFCGEPLEEENFEKFMVQIGHSQPRTLELPICSRDRSLATALLPDGRNHTLDMIANAVPMGLLTVTAKLAQFATPSGGHQDSVNIQGVRRRFVAERAFAHLSPKEYDKLMAKANEIRRATARQ